MKKIIFSLLFLFSAALIAQTPLASKSLPQDSLTGLNKEVRAWQMTIDTKSKKIIVVYDVVLISNNVVVSVLETNSYTRENKTNSMKFDEFIDESTGTALKQMIDDVIDNYPNLSQ